MRNITCEIEFNLKMKRNTSNVMRMNILMFYIKWRNSVKQILKYEVIFVLINEIKNEFN